METESSEENSTAQEGGLGLILPIIGLLLLIAGVVIFVKRDGYPPELAPSTDLVAAEDYGDTIVATNFFNPSNQVTYSLEQDLPADSLHASVNTGTNSNIRRADYSGSEACVECHQDKYDDWSKHSHRWMNAMAVEPNVKGDFSGTNNIRYQGGIGTFFMEDGEYRMRTERSDRTRSYRITRTIGSRFFQYYVGRLIESSHQEQDDMYAIEHVLPFGFWIGEGQWVPTVHVFREPHHEHSALDLFAGERIALYDYGCSGCHTTWPYGDWMMTRYGSHRLSSYSPRAATIESRNYLESEHPELVAMYNSDTPETAAGYEKLVRQIEMIPSEGHRVNLGIACEACHNGSQEHIAKSTKTNTTQRPYFFPVNPNIHSNAKDFTQLVSKSDGNVNMICARCHTGGRPEYANGIHTWNSTEFTDGTKGFCYQRGPESHPNAETLTCIHCHDPHQATGPKWQRTAQQDDQSCVSCHEQFTTATAIEQHTHHRAGSAGSHCMDCHMPKINEGLEDMVRTHRIFNPTDPKMLEANQPNACNLCHLDKPIDWTITHLREWYGQEHRYAESKIFRNYPQRKSPVGLGWLNSPHNTTRLSAARAMSVSDDFANWLPHLINFVTEDSHLINRQFIQLRLDEELGIKLRNLGFNFYQPREERRAIMAQIRPQLESGTKSAQ